MAHSYKPRRNKLKSHDSGEDRHSKGVAHENKAARLAAQHQRTVSSMRRAKVRSGLKKASGTLKLLEEFDAQQEHMRE